MRLLVTGGAGYIGSVLTEELLQAGHQVVVFDNLTRGYRGAVHPDAVFVRADLCDADVIERVFIDHPGIEAVVHCATNTLVAESWQQPARYLSDNVANGTNLIVAAARHDVRRFILLSSADIFGGPQPVPLIEHAAVFPSSPYGESLYLLERILSWYDRIAGMRFASLRCFGVAGATERCGEYHVPETQLIPLLLSVALGQRTELVLRDADYHTPDGTCIRDYIHVVDVARAIIQVLPALERSSRIYNLGAGTGYSTKEVIAVARQVTGHPLPYIVGPRQPFEPVVQIASTARIRKELGWEPQFTGLEHMVGSAWAWRQRHPHGYAAQRTRS